MVNVPLLVIESYIVCTWISFTDPFAMYALSDFILSYRKEASQDKVLYSIQADSDGKKIFAKTYFGEK